MKFLPKISRILKVPKSLTRKPGFKAPDVRDFKADMETLGEQIAEGFKQKVITNIQDNTYGFSDSPRTVKLKGSDIPLIDTGQLVGAIYREGTTVSVDDSTRSDSSLTNKQLAIIQEYGTKDRHIPARPVWRNTFDDYKEEAKEQIREFFEEEHKFKKPKEHKVTKKQHHKKKGK